MDILVRLYFAENARNRNQGSSGSDTSRLSAAHIYNVIERLKMKKNCDTTNRNYLGIWRHFNRFLIRLDYVPGSWEQRTILFRAHLIEQGLQSATIRSYISAIKSVVQDDDYEWDDNQILLTTLTRACKMTNDVVFIRRPIRRNVLEAILFEVDRVVPGQPYLIAAYRAIFALAYYGLFRIGELVKGDHPAKAKDVHIATNKKKILIVLHSSKTHGKHSRPQKIKISADSPLHSQQKKWFCPFELAINYMRLRGDYKSLHDQFFVFRDNTPISAANTRKIFKITLSNLNLNVKHFDFHSLRVGRASELLKLGYSIDQIKLFGRWKSNAVFRYLKD